MHAGHTVPSTIERQTHALRQTQTSRTKACSQVHMTFSGLCYFVFGEIPTLNSLPLSISGQDLYRRECWTYSHHCQIADKNPSKTWNGKFRGFRICIGWISTTRFLLWVFMCSINFSLFFRVSFSATTPRATTPIQMHSS